MQTLNRGGFQARPDAKSARDLLHNEKYQGVSVNGVRELNDEVRLSVGGDASTGAVLVIEDCEPLLFFLNSALLALGYQEQHLAANLAEAEAVWAIHKDQIRHVILNYELPDGIGTEFAARIVRERPDINVIITTGYELSAVKDSYNPEAPLRFLQKPFRLADLQQELARIVTQKV